jgi:ubiquinone/menaquinone biosynthesis C-methylase UbiE
MPNPNKRINSHKRPLTIRIFASFLHQFFKLLYHQFAWTYDAVAWLVSLGAWSKWVSAVLPYLNGPKTLEIGFGPGHLQAALHQAGITPIGLDESNQMSRITKQRITRLGFESKLVRGDAKALPFAERSFNQLVMTFPSEYILNPTTLSEIHRVLIDDGMAVMLPLAWVTGRKSWERAVGWFTHITGESPEWHEQYLDAIKNAGFNVDWEILDLGSSKILVIRMVKPTSSRVGLQSF